MEQYKQILIAKIEELSKSSSPFAKARMSILIKSLKALK